MTIAESITDAISFARSLGDICLVVAIVGCIFTLVAAPALSAFRTSIRTGRPPSRRSPCSSRCMARNPVCRAASPRSAGRTMAVRCRSCAARKSRLRRPSPSWARSMAISPDTTDRACRRSAQSWRQPQGIEPDQHACRAPATTRSCSPTAISSSGRDYLRARHGAAWRSRGVGAVTCLYHGIGGDGLWTRFRRSPSTRNSCRRRSPRSASGWRKPCCGATIALRRSMLDRIGGFSALADVLADDHAIGVAVRAEGYEVVTAPFLVGHRCFEASLRELMRQQIRVARTIKSIDPIAYAGTIITHPWPLALLGMLSGSPAAALGRRRGAAGAGDALPLRRMAVRLAAAELLAHSAAGPPCVRRLCRELLRGDGALAGRRLSAWRRTAPCSKDRT